MKGLILLIAVCCLVLLNGCASLSYKTANGTEVTYTRFLTSMDSIEAKVGEAYVKANKIEVDIPGASAVGLMVK